MDIQNIGTDYNQSNILDQVGVIMLSRGLKQEQADAEELFKSLGPESPLPEGSGTRVDLLA
jgi:hypothetical protein